MAVPQSLTEAMGAIDTATNDVAAVLEQLRAAISTGMSAEDVSSVNTTLAAAAAKLKGLAANPEIPVPPGPAVAFNRSPRR